MQRKWLWVGDPSRWLGYKTTSRQRDINCWCDARLTTSVVVSRISIDFERERRRRRYARPTVTIWRVIGVFIADSAEPPLLAPIQCQSLLSHTLPSISIDYSSVRYAFALVLKHVELKAHCTSHAPSQKCERNWKNVNPVPTFYAAVHLAVQIQYLLIFMFEL